MELMARLVRSWTVESKLRRSGSARHAASYELRSALGVELEFGVGSEILRAGGGGRRQLLLRLIRIPILGGFVKNFC